MYRVKYKQKPIGVSGTELLRIELAGGVYHVT